VQRRPGGPLGRPVPFSRCWAELLFPRTHVGWPRDPLQARPSFLCVTDDLAPLVGHPVLFLVAEPESITDPDSNPRTEGLFSQIDHATTLFKLEPSLARRF
jgi:hypothetical protein